jgi:hypothetical protein
VAHSLGGARAIEAGENANMLISDERWHQIISAAQLGIQCWNARTTAAGLEDRFGCNIQNSNRCAVLVTRHNPPPPRFANYRVRCKVTFLPFFFIYQCLHSKPIRIIRISFRTIKKGGLTMPKAKQRPCPQSKPTPTSKQKFTCIQCGQNVWAKPRAQVTCAVCYPGMLLMQPGCPSYALSEAAE